MSSAVKPIPDGYATVTPAIHCRGAGKAIEYYKKAFGAVEIMRVPLPNGTIMHAEIRIGNSIVFLGDENPEMGAKSPQSLGGSTGSLFLYVENVDAAFKRAIDAGGKVVMPVADMFWGDRMGALEDPFGHKWSIGQHTRDLTPEQIKKGQAEALAQFEKK